MSAAPASGKFGGFGSEDLTKFGYNQPGQFGQAYDPYVKSGGSGSTAKTEPDRPTKKDAHKKDSDNKKKRRKKKKHDSDSSDDDDSSDSSDDSSSEESEEEDKPKKKSS